jgi:phosphoribosylglycinamide formyltransferase-1
MLDEGEVIMQRRVPVLPGDDAATLEARLLAEEHMAVIEAVESFGRPSVNVSRSRIQPEAAS